MKKYLTPEAIADGAKSGLSEKDMRAAGMYSLTLDEARKYRIEAGYVIPYSDGFFRIKILKQNSKFGELRKQKYTQPPRMPPRLYLSSLGGIDWKRIAKDPTKPLLITEGEKKAAAACKAKYACIGLGGVFNFAKNGQLLPDWENFNLTGRSITIVYDSDAASKLPVRCAEYLLAIQLIARGASVTRVRLPQPKGGEKVGLDDFLITRGFPSNVNAARAAFDALPREKIDPAYPPHLTELGNAIRFANEFKDKLRYVPQMKRWIVQDEDTRLWKVDKDGAAMRCAKSLPYLLAKEAEKLAEEKIVKTFNKWARTSESEKSLNATVKLAATEPEVILDEEVIDSDPWALAFKNGKAIDLRTGTLRNIESDDFFMKSIGTSYDPNAKCPRFEKFALEIMRGDKELAAFLQRVVGYCLTGDMSAQCFFVFYGHGANGKTTLLNTLLAMQTSIANGLYGSEA